MLETNAGNSKLATDQVGGITPGENHTARTKRREDLTQFQKLRFLVRQINSQYEVSFASQPP